MLILISGRRIEKWPLVIKVGVIDVLCSSSKGQKLLDSSAAWRILHATFKETISHPIFSILTTEAVKFTTTLYLEGWNMFT